MYTPHMKSTSLRRDMTATLDLFADGVDDTNYRRIRFDSLDGATGRCQLRNRLMTCTGVNCVSVFRWRRCAGSFRIVMILYLGNVFFPVIEHVLFLVQMFTTIARLLLDYCTTIHCCVDMTVVNSFQPMETLNTGTVHIV